MYCWNCGAENEENARFCRNCGSDLREEKDDGGSSAKGENRKPIFLIAVICAVLCIMAGGIFYWYLTKDLDGLSSRHIQQTESTEDKSDKGTVEKHEEGGTESDKAGNNKAGGEKTEPETDRDTDMGNGTGETMQAEDEYILPESSRRLLTDSEVKALSKEQLRLARNEIFARHGRKFDDAGLKNYFESKAWYTGVIEPDDFTESMLSEIEKKNIDLIKKYEK